MPFDRRIGAADALTKRHVSLRRAHSIITRLAEGERVAVMVPVVENVETFERDLLAADVVPTRRQAPEKVDVRAIRDRLGLTQEEFAARFALDPASVRNWEQGRTRPEAPIRSYLRVIDKHGEVVEEMLSEVAR